MLEYLSTMTKRNEKIDELEKIGICRSKAEQSLDKFIELFDNRSSTLQRDLVGMEEVKCRLNHKGEITDQIKRDIEKKNRLQQ